MSPQLLPTPSVSPSPLPVRPPQIIAEAGILPTSVFSAFDRLSELFDRSLFSFGIPTLRARIALTQAAERIAELQALERAGRLTPASARGLLQAHERLLTIADRIVARQLAAGAVPPDLLFLLIRTRLAAAGVLEELEEEAAAERELDKEEFSSPAPTGAFPEAATLDPVDDEVKDLAELLDEEIEELVEFEDGMIPPGASAIPPNVLRFLAEQKVAKAERDLLRAVRKVEERLAQGKVLIADTELRASADAALVTARQLFAAENFAEALRIARDVRRIADRLKSGQIALESNALRSGDAERRVERILQQLVEHGFLGVDAQSAALLRARQAIEQVRRNSGTAFPTPRPGENGADRDEDDDKDKKEKKEEDKDGSRGSDSGSSGSEGGSSRSGSSGSGSSGSGR
ncbi:MAG: hypothetical protein G01um101438_400 [Parcubacteria group bacterium Gr01-1014_38]|nr:MAG: hypothetical protein G01um101438_400 [Parcubacteria group bacterium Gr01-1014_38]